MTGTVEHTLITLPGASSLSAKAAGFAADRIQAAVSANGELTFAVSRGQTPWLMLTDLAQQDLPWTSVTIYQVDERITPDGDPARNLTRLRQILGSRGAGGMPSSAVSKAPRLVDPGAGNRPDLSSARPGSS